ncbi:L-cysteine desulfidase [Lachnospiraceae bacterium PF1-21]|uniref:L-cysteine desulfidase family protein n=1 Tax=Ohessyouella blattaphilus TaxID=2949333 RepID=UPI003E23A071
MDKKMKDGFISTLRRELVPALGCTEPIALAYAGAKAREILGCMPEKLEISCSGNIIKNVKGVTVPNSNGLSGVDVAAILGVVGGNAQRELEVLEDITAEDIAKTKELLATDFFTCTLQENVANLYIVATAKAGNEEASVKIVNRHTLVTEIVKNGEVIFRENPVDEASEVTDWSLWSIKNILDFAKEVDLSEIEEVISRQIEMNSAISEAGLANDYGAQVGRTLLAVYGDDVKVRARAKAAAGSDARMNGCSLPVVINSGSGNQGMTVSVPVIEYAKELKVGTEGLYRSLVVSNLVSIYHKHYIGSLSAFCGAVTAACGCGAAITYMSGGTYEQICHTIINVVANVGGIVCDGAKSSCAAKIASSVDAAILAHHLSMKGLAFKAGEGIVQSNIEDTIKSIGYIGRVGMKNTDIEILNIMIDNERTLSWKKR